MAPAGLSKAATEVVENLVTASVSPLLTKINSFESQLSTAISLLQSAAATGSTKQQLIDRLEVVNADLTKRVSELEALVRVKNAQIASLESAVQPRTIGLEASAAAGEFPLPVTGTSNSLARSGQPNDGPSRSSSHANSSVEENTWVKVVRKNRKRMNCVAGSATVESGNPLAAVSTGYPVKVFVSRLSPTISSSELEAAVLANAGVTVSATPLVSKMPKLYSSYMLHCISTDLKPLLHPTAWPKGLVVKRWFSRRRSSSESSQREGLHRSTATDAPAQPHLPSTSFSTEESHVDPTNHQQEDAVSAISEDDMNASFGSVSKEATALVGSDVHKHLEGGPTPTEGKP